MNYKSFWYCQPGPRHAKPVVKQTCTRFLTYNALTIECITSPTGLIDTLCRDDIKRRVLVRCARHQTQHTQHVTEVSKDIYHRLGEIPHCSCSTIMFELAWLLMLSKIRTPLSSLSTYEFSSIASSRYSEGSNYRCLISPRTCSRERRGRKGGFKHHVPPRTTWKTVFSLKESRAKS